MKHLELFRAMIVFFAHQEERKELADDPSKKQRPRAYWTSGWGAKRLAAGCRVFRQWRDRKAGVGKKSCCLSHEQASCSSRFCLDRC